MNHIFQFSVYTTQHLFLEGLQRLLRSSCCDEERQRRNSLKSIITLLLKTAATGILATILDAAIEYRRRQLLLTVSGEEPALVSDEDEHQRLFAHLGIGNLTRSGIAAWKSRLLLAIDEMERQAGHYGIEPSHRFAPDNGEVKEVCSGCDACPGSHVADGDEKPSDVDADVRKAALARTVQQLLDLVEAKSDDATIDSKVDCLVGELLMEHGRMPSSSCGEGKLSEDEEDFIENLSPSVCTICMDRDVRVHVVGCTHKLCFQCARKLCDSADHQLPQCPYCRRPIEGFSACPQEET